VNRKLIGSETTIRALTDGEEPRLLRQKQQDATESFLTLRAKYLLYQ
jgi:hypothetical protein